MKLSILSKILAVMLIVAVLPLITLGFLAVNDEKAVGMSAAEDARILGDSTLISARYALENLGEDMIEQKAQDVAKQCEIYLEAHPGMSISELQSSPEFQEIAVQKVGDTGYTYLYETDPATIRLHPDSEMMDVSMSDLKEQFPAWWGIIRPTLSGLTICGYYDWQSSSGEVHEKFAYMTPVEGTPYVIAATTYISEFSEPVNKIETKVNSEIDNTIDKIKVSTESVSTQNTILLMTLMTILVVVIVSYFFASSLTSPIKRLTAVADRVSMGDMADTDIDIESEDEIGELAESFKRMIVSVKYYMSKVKDQNNDGDD